MSTKKSRKSSPQRIAANRRNAQKSTGPRGEEGKTRVAMNSYKHGFYAAPDSKTREQMLRLGEDPDLLARFERELTEAWQPTDAMQAMMVADLARLYADKELLRQAVRARRLDQMKSQAEREGPIDKIKLEDFGYRGVAPCAAAFAESQKLLNHLAERLENRQWNADEDLNQTIQLLYGKRPQESGRRFLGQFEILAGLRPESDKNPIEGCIREIGAEIAEMKAQVLAEESEYRQLKEKELMDAEDSQCVPGTRGWGMVMKQEARVDRMIDGKVKLLVRLRHQRWRTRRAAPGVEAGREAAEEAAAKSECQGEETRHQTSLTEKPPEEGDPLLAVGCTHETTPGEP